MEIDPNLLVLKPVSELETVNNPTTGSLLFYDGGDELKKTSVAAFYNAMESAYLGIATTTTTPPATGAYWYKAIEAVTYTNFKYSSNAAIEVTEADLDGNEVFLEVKDNVATKMVRVIPAIDTKLPLYSAIKSANIPEGTQFIDDENGNLIYRVKAGQTLLTTDLPADVIGTKTEKQAQTDKQYEGGIDISNEVSKQDGFYINALDNGKKDPVAGYSATDFINISEVVFFEINGDNYQQFAYYDKNKINYVCYK